MNKQPNNPPAFPIGAQSHCQPYDGMTLRDYFAAHALAGIKMAPEESVDITDKAAIDAFAAQVAMLAGAIADAMLEERERNAR